MRPRTGDPVLAEGQAITSITIRLGIFSLYSHTETLYIPLGMENEPDKWLCISAESSGVKVMPLNRYRNGAKAHIFRVSCDDEAALRAHYKGMEAVRSKKKYNWLGLLYNGTVTLARLIGIFAKNPALIFGHAILKRLPNPVGKGMWYCTSLVQHQYLPEVGKFVQVHQDMLSPEDIARSKKTKKIAIYSEGLKIL